MPRREGPYMIVRVTPTVVQMKVSAMRSHLSHCTKFQDKNKGSINSEENEKQNDCDSCTDDNEHSDVGDRKSESKKMGRMPQILNVSVRKVTQPPSRKARAHESDEHDANTHISTHTGLALASALSNQPNHILISPSEKD